MGMRPSRQSSHVRWRHLYAVHSNRARTCGGRQEAEEEPKAPIDARNLFDEKFKKVRFCCSISQTEKKVILVIRALRLRVALVETLLATPPTFFSEKKIAEALY